MKIRVLFVCLGNICRSSSAEAIFTALVDRAGLSSYFHIDSAGTGGWHVNNPPDKRAVKEGLSRGYEHMQTLRARQLIVDDAVNFDYVLVMDHQNHEDTLLRFELSDEGADNVTLFLDYSHQQDYEEVPDPYYGGDDGFVTMFNLLEDASQGFLNVMCEKYQLNQN